MLPGKSRISRSRMSIAAVWTFRPDSQRDDGRTYQFPFRSNGIDKAARRGLGENPRDTSHGERETNTLFIPPVTGEVNRKEWPDSGLDVRQKEIQPVKAAQGAYRRPRRVRRSAFS